MAGEEAWTCPWDAALELEKTKQQWSAAGKQETSEATLQTGPGREHRAACHCWQLRAFSVVMGPASPALHALTQFTDLKSSFLGKNIEDTKELAIGRNWQYGKLLC